MPASFINQTTFAPPVASGAGDAIAEGLASTVARSDHKHGSSFSSSAAQTVSVTGLTVSLSDTSSTASITKTGLSVSSTGTWSGGSAVSRGLYVTATGGTNNYAAIFDQGNVGIGTTNPICNLHVSINSSAGNSPFLMLENTAGTTPNAFGPGVVFKNNVSGSNPFIMQMYQSSGSVFSINNFVSPYTPYLSITQGGAVGIGTTSPISFVEINAQSGTSELRVRNTAASGVAGNTYVTLDSGVASNGYISFQHNTVIKWYVYSDIGTNRLYATNSGLTGAYLSSGGTSWTATSDERLKNIIGEIPDALDKVAQLKGVEFTWKNESDEAQPKKRVGLIAQDVNNVLPEAIDDQEDQIVVDKETGKLRGGLGVRYTEVVPLLVNAIKELKAENDDMKRRLTAAGI